MFYLLLIMLIIADTASASTIPEPIGFYQYTEFQAPLSWETISGNSMERAMDSCQESFKWQRWNCPRNDFFQRYTVPATAQDLDREDVYVAVIAMASIVYTLTTDCANGAIAGCGCSENALVIPCDHDPSKAIELYKQRYGAGTGASSHNQRVVEVLLKQSLEEECHCKQHDDQDNCLEEHCVQVLTPFETIAQELLRLYDDAIQLDASASNVEFMWKNIPLDSLVYMRDSPNYCDPEANDRWPGTRGRQCSKSPSNSVDERLSCQQLCRVCGFRVRSQHKRTERRCNCVLVWGFRLHCDVCVQLDRHYSCF